MHRLSDHLVTVAGSLAVPALAFLRWLVGLPSRRAMQALAEQNAVWREASAWRMEQASEITSLRAEVRTLSAEVHALRLENERWHGLACAIENCPKRKAVT